MSDEIKEYSNGEITIKWEASKCIHSGNCVRGLPGVFNPQERPWIKIDNADTAHLTETVDKCPSGALSWVSNNEESMEDRSAAAAAGDVAKVNIFKDGPIEVKGSFTMTDADGNEVDMDKVYLCRCGASAKKPFCDGSHKKAGFTD